MLPLLWLLLPAFAVSFMVPDCRLQAGYPRGMRVWIPDVPGIERFTFRGQLNSPIRGEESGGLLGTVTVPFGGYWIFKVDGLVLNPGDVLYFWTIVIKEHQRYFRPNQTWTVPSRDKFVDLNSPIPSPDVTEQTPTTDSTKPEIEERTPQGTITTKLTTSTTPDSTQSKSSTITTEITTKLSTTPKTTSEPTTSKLSTTEGMTYMTTPTETTMVTDVTESETKPTEGTTNPTSETSETTIPTTKLTEETTDATEPTMKPTDSTIQPTTKSKTPPVDKRSTTEATKLEDRMPNFDLVPPKNEDDIETTTPSLDKPVSEFSEEPSFGPFPPFFPGPYRPMFPPINPVLDACSNPFNFIEKKGESKIEKLERQLNKLQCELGEFKKKFSQLNNVVENELMDIKKLNYNMVNRMARLETLLLRASSSWS